MKTYSIWYTIPGMAPRKIQAGDLALCKKLVKILEKASTARFEIKEDGK